MFSLLELTLILKILRNSINIDDINVECSVLSISLISTSYLPALAAGSVLLGPGL